MKASIDLFRIFRLASVPFYWESESLPSDYFSKKCTKAKKIQAEFTFEVNGVKYRGFLVGRCGVFEVQFEAADVGTSLAEDRGHSAIQVLDTVIKAVAEKVEEYKIAIIGIGSEIQRRSKLYRKFADNASHYLPGNWELVKTISFRHVDPSDDWKYSQLLEQYIENYNPQYKAKDYSKLSPEEIGASVAYDVLLYFEGDKKEAKEKTNEFTLAIINDLANEKLGGVTTFFIIRNKDNVEFWQSIFGNQYEKKMTRLIESGRLY